MTRVASHPIRRRARVVLSNAQGLHARAAACLVKIAEAHDAELWIGCRGNRANAKSIMGLLTLGAGAGTTLNAIAQGPEADKMIAAVRELFAHGFYE